MKKGVSDSSGLAEFWRYAAGLKKQPRRGWIEKFELRRPESVADHSYAVALICLFEAERRGGYDLERLLKLALIHDLDEAITGDLTPEDKRKMGNSAVVRARRTAMEQILSAVPAPTRPEYRRLWSDLGLRRTREAKLVKDLDYVEMAFQAKEYSKQVTRKQRVEEFCTSAKNGVRDKRLRMIFSSSSEEKSVRPRPRRVRRVSGRL